MSQIINIYEKAITKFKLITILITLLITAFFAYQTKNFRLDASSDTLVLQGNKNLEYYSKIKKRYGSDSYLIITYTPNSFDLLSEESLSILTEMKKNLLEVKKISNVTSILDVPLIESPKIGLSDLADGDIINIEKGNFSNIEDVRKEIVKHTIYKDALVSADGKTSSLLVSIENSDKHDIAEIRGIVSKYKDRAEIFIGGVPMIVSDSIDYIDSDIKTFGLGVIALIILILAISFKKVKWVVIPLANSLIASVILVGLLGYIDWPVTVVSSNFISLLLIISISLSVHLIVQYEEYLHDGEFKDQADLILKTVEAKFNPCFFTAITTIVAFCSLVISDVKPIIDFGWMMVMGIIVSFIITFTFMPAIMGIFKLKNKSENIEFHKKITGGIYNLTASRKFLCFSVFAAVIIICGYGITKLSVQNRFIDYFKEHTEIYQGMEVIDTRLGGTTPLEVILNAPKDYKGDSYWFNSFILEDVAYIHEYLESIKETGKVISISSTVELLKTLNDGEVDAFLLGIIKDKIPANIKEILISPYLSENGNQIRFSIRVYESMKGMNRQALIDKIRADLKEEFYLKDEDIKITGMLVLYNDLLQSLFKSQIMTLGSVFIAITFMFIILFRNIKISLIAIIPNMVAATCVLGVMGLLGISLDIMTITIAAICVGIAVDDTIHYVHRFLEEFEKDHDVWPAVKRAHNTIGRAIYLTTLTISLGFSILAFSNFVPTIYFGLLTGFSMIIALLADLILLPIVLGIFYKKK